MRRLLPCIGLLATLLCSACVPQGQAFRVDNRLSITAPADRQEVTLPVTLRWKIEDFDVVTPGTPPRGDAGYFAVFVDRAPMPPGKDLGWLARNDRSCRASEGCPNAEYFASLNVYTTSDTELVLEQVPALSGRGRERHVATIVLLDGAGTRIGESAFRAVFDVDREAQP